MAMRIAELRKSECCPVIGQIEVALPLWDNITSPETEQTSRWCSTSRTFAEPINEAKQMTTAQAVGAASHTPGGFIHRRASWSQGRSVTRRGAPSQEAWGEIRSDFCLKSLARRGFLPKRCY